MHKIAVDILYFYSVRKNRIVIANSSQILSNLNTASSTFTAVFLSTAETRYGDSNQSLPGSEPETEDLLTVGDALEMLLFLPSPSMTHWSFAMVGSARSSPVP